MPGARTCRADAGFPNTTVVIYGCRLSIILPKRHSGPDSQSMTPGKTPGLRPRIKSGVTFFRRRDAVGYRVLQLSY